MEKTAKLILNERRYESNTKRHLKHLEDESLYRKDHFESLKEKRSERRQYVKDHDHKLGQKGYERYKKDHRAIEENIEKTQANEKQHAVDVFINQKKQMATTEQKEKEWVEQFDLSAQEAKQTLHTIQENIQKKSEVHSRTIETIKDKLRTQFETQRNNFEKFEEKNEEKQNIFSRNAVVKYNAQRAKSKEIAERTNHSIEEHRTKNVERFQTRDEGLKKVKDDRAIFLRREEKRHKSHISAREVILKNIKMENEQKAEMQKLRIMDN